MKKAGMMCAALLIGFMVATTGSAQTDGADKAPQAQEKTAVCEKRIKTTEPVKRFMGEMVGMDAEAKTITARGRKGECLFDISNARIARNTKLETLKPGDRIGIVYIEKDGAKIAKVVGKPATRAKRSKGAGQAPNPENPASAPETTK